MLGVAHAGGAQDLVDQGARPGGEAARGHVDGARALPGAGRAGELGVHVSDQGLPAGRGAQGGGHLADIAAHVGEAVGLADIDHLDPAFAQAGQEARVGHPVHDHDLGAGGQHRLQVRTTQRHADSGGPHHGIGVVGPLGDPDDRLAGAQRQHVLVSAVVEREDTGAGLGGGRKAKHHQGDDR